MFLILGIVKVSHRKGEEPSRICDESKAIAEAKESVVKILGDYGLNSRVLVLEPVYAGQERKYYKIVEGQGKSRLELVCTEISSEDMYGLPE